MKSDVWISVLLLAVILDTDAYKIKIGIVNVQGSDRRQNNEKFWSFGQNYSPTIQLEPVVQEIPWWSGLEVARAVCSLAQAGVKALVVQAPPRLGPLVASYADSLQLPLATEMDVDHSLGRSQISILPDTTVAAATLLQSWEWESFGFVYDTDTGAEQLQKLFELMDTSPQVEPFWRAYTSNDAYHFIQNIPRNISRLVLATSEVFADELFAKLSSFPRRMHGILLKPVGVVVHGTRSTGLTRLTKFSFLNAGSTELMEFENRWNTLDERVQRARDKELPDSALLSSDISRVFHSLLGAVDRDHPEVLRNNTGFSDCFGYSAGISFTKNAISVNGISGPIRFNQEGRRVGYTLNVVEPIQFNLRKIATWSDESGLQLSEAAKRDSVPTYAAYRRNEPPIRVTSILSQPFLMKNDKEELVGFIADLLDGLRNVTGREFDMHLVKDGKYGLRIKGTWVGMVGELVNNETDVVLADLTKTVQRAEAVDYCKTYLTDGLTVLMKKVSGADEGASRFGPFSFLSVWPVEMWMVLLVVVVIFATTSYFISRLTGTPDRVRALESKGTDNLSPCGSFWFTIGALFLRDTGIYPRTFTHRLWAILWWTFCFFILVSYISSLTAALIQTRRTVVGTHSRKTSHEVLEDLMTKGSPSIGTLNSGSTVSFFRGSNIGIYRDFGRYLNDNPDVLSFSRDAAIKRVRDSNGSFAFITESLSNRYYSNQAPCDILESVGFFNTISFAPAVRKNSNLRDVIDRGVLALTEDGTLRRLYEKWWHLSNKYCEDPNMDLLQSVYDRSMKLHEVSGVFYILCVGAVLSVAATAFDHYLSSKRSPEYVKGLGTPKYTIDFSRHIPDGGHPRT